MSFDFCAKDRRDAKKKIGAFARRTGERAIQMAQDDFGELVIRGGGAQQIGIEHGGVADSGDGVRGAAAADFFLDFGAGYVPPSRRSARAVSN